MIFDKFEIFDSVVPTTADLVIYYQIHFLHLFRLQLVLLQHFGHTLR